MVVESSSGGTGRHVLDLCHGLADRGCDVHLLFSTGRVDRLFLNRVGSLNAVRSTPLPMKTGVHPSDAAAVLATRRYLKEFGPFDVIHGHSSKGGAIARLAALGTGATAFYTLHGFVAMDSSRARWERMVYLLIEMALSRHTGRIIAVSPEEQRVAVRLGLGRSRVRLIPNGVGASELAPRDSARREIGAKDHDVVIGFVGRFVSQKAPHVLLQAMREVAGASPRSRLAMVGAGPLEASLRTLAENIGIADRIIWLGERDARLLMAGFDVFAIPSCMEGLPYVVLEAMSAGLPVVATDTAGVESLVTTGVNGIVVPSGDAIAFGAALVSLVRDPARLARCGRASLERVARFTIDAMVDKTLGMYAGVESLARSNAEEAAPVIHDELAAEVVTL